MWVFNSHEETQAEATFFTFWGFFLSGAGFGVLNGEDSFLIFINKTAIS